METLYYSRLQSPVGPLLIGVSEEALVALEFDRGLPQKIGGLPVQWEQSEARTRAVRQQLQEYFAGKRRNFDLALDLRGTEFYKRCWQQLLQIPYGETCSYADIARAVGSPEELPRRRTGEPSQPDCHHCIGAGRRLLPRGIRRRASGEGISAAVGRAAFREREASDETKQLAFPRFR